MSKVAANQECKIGWNGSRKNCQLSSNAKRRREAAKISYCVNASEVNAELSVPNQSRFEFLGLETSHLTLTFPYIRYCSNFFPFLKFWAN